MTDAARQRATLPRMFGERPGARALFGAGYALAVSVTALGVWLTATAPASAPVATSSRTVLIVLSANLLLIGVLATGAALSVAKLLRGRARDAGARLHLRFATLFAMAALAPAVVVALFFGLIVTRGVDSWFSNRVQTVVENHAAVATLLLESQTDLLEAAVAPTASDLGRYADDLRANPTAYGRLLADQAEARGFRAIYVVDRAGQVLARAEPQPSSYLAPPAAAFDTADREGSSFRTFEGEDLVRVLFPLQGVDDAYVYLSAPLPEGMLDKLFDSEAAVIAYRDAEANQGQVQTVFVLSYAETALLVLIGAVWLGLAMATSIARPIAGLVEAADRVAGGDLNARVEVQREPEEIANLSRAFNRMTSDLNTQQEALRTAGREAESRRRFIETVLSEVSAGVVGLDAQGRVSAANRQAAVLLGLDGEGPLGRTLDEIAPEFAGMVGSARRHGQSEGEHDVTRDGEVRRLRVRASGAADGGLVLTFDDVTRLIAAQRLAAWKDVARRIAHEIKNPLTPIQLSAERLRRKYRSQITGDLETFDRCTDTIVRQVGDIGRMVDEFSAFARMPSPRFGEEDAAELLRRAAFAQRVAYADVAVELEDPAGPERFTCDGRMVAQALTNVLKNAGEAVAARRQTQPDLQGLLRLRLEHDADTVCFIVDDNGVGLPAKGRERLTEPYVTTREKGTGLGLAIVKRVMEDHGGELRLEDAPEPPGARAVLRFPRRPSAAAFASAAE